MFVGIYIAILFWLFNGYEQMKNKKPDEKVKPSLALFALFYMVLAAGTAGFTLEIIIDQLKLWFI